MREHYTTNLFRPGPLEHLCALEKRSSGGNHIINQKNFFRQIFKSRRISLQGKRTHHIFYSSASIQKCLYGSLTMSHKHIHTFHAQFFRHGLPKHSTLIKPALPLALPEERDRTDPHPTSTDISHPANNHLRKHLSQLFAVSVLEPVNDSPEDFIRLCSHKHTEPMTHESLI